MRKWVTSLRAENPETGEIREYAGPMVEADTIEQARAWCKENRLGYLRIDGLLVSTIPCKEGAITPDWDRQVDEPEAGHPDFSPRPAGC